MNHSKRWLAGLAALMMIGSVLAGCGSGSSSSTPAGSGSEGETGPVTLKMISSTEFEQQEFSDIEGLLAKFPDKAPNVKIEGEFIPWTELDNKLFLTNAGNEYYDVILVNNSSLPALVEAGILADMSEFAEADGFDIEGTFTPAMADLCHYKDGIYALPFNTDTRVLAVNTDMLEEAGQEIPQTKEDMLEVAKAVTKDLDGDGVIDQYGYAMNISRTLPCVYIQGNWLVANGLHLYDKMEDGSYVCQMDTPAGLDFFNWAAEMGKYIPNDMISYDNAMIDNAFASGKFAMYTYGAWMLARDDFEATVAESGVNYKLILNPEGLEGTASTSGGWMLGISPKCENKQAAWDFIKFIVDPEVNASICSGLSPVKEAYNYPPFDGEEYDILQQQLETSHTAVAEFVPEFNELVDVYGNNLIAAILGEKTPDQAAQEAAAGINKILKEKGYQS